MNRARLSMLFALWFFLAACGRENAADPAPDQTAETLSKKSAVEGARSDWSFAPDAVFPADQSLTRPEDGVLLADGRLLVGDQIHGLSLLSADGSSRPFGRFVEAGYEHNPPTQEGGANGVALEPDGSHVLVADVIGGGIYRVALDDETTTRVYQHAHGVNTAVADSNGGIWFTQSTANLQADGHAGIFSAVAAPRPDGVLFYLPPEADGEPREPVVRIDGLLFANGVALDEANAKLFVAETMAHRVLQFSIAEDGALTERTVLVELTGPDNIELGADSRLWIAQPINNQISVVDLDTGATDVAFSVSTAESRLALLQISERMARGEDWMDLLTPTLWQPVPAMMTGLILAPDGTPRYWTGLGKAIVRLD